MTPLGPRDRALVMILPALVAAALYVVVFARPMAAELAQAKAGLAAALSAGVAEPPAGRLGELREELARLEAARERLGAVAPAAAVASSPPARAGRLLRILEAHGLVLVADVAASPGALRAPAALLRRLEGAADRGATLREVAVRGRYLDALEALEALGREDGVHALKLSMERAKDGGPPLWRVFVWM